MGTAHATWPLAKSLCRLAVEPSALGQIKSLCAASLAAGGYDRPFGLIDRLFLLSPVRCFILRPDYSYKYSYSFPTASSILHLGTILPGLGTAHASWPPGLRFSAITILQSAASLAAGGYDRPCGPIESLLLLSPARILDGRARLYSSELSYSYCMALSRTEPRRQS